VRWLLLLYRRRRRRSKGRQARPIRGAEVLGSFAADIDLVVDWLFASVKGSNTALPSSLRVAIWCLVCLRTISYILILTQCYGCRGLLGKWEVAVSTGLILLLGIIIEDLPQVILSIVVDQYEKEEDVLMSYDGESNWLAAANAITAVYDVFIKLAEAYDERHAMVKLKKKFFFGKNFGDSTAEVAEALRSFRYVNANECGITDVGIERLAAALEDGDCVVEWLALCRNNISEKGFARLALAITRGAPQLQAVEIDRQLSRNEFLRRFGVLVPRTPRGLVPNAPPQEQSLPAVLPNAQMLGCAT